jgi:hypothetical protein
MGFGWNTLTDPFKGVPVVGGALEAAYDMLPIDNFVRSGQEFSKGNWAGGLGNLGYGALETAALFIPGAGSAALKGASAAAKGATSARKAGVIARGLAAPGKAVTKAKLYPSLVKAAPAKTIAGSALKYARPDKASFVVGAVDNYTRGKPATAKSVISGLPRTTSSAANFRMIEEKQKADSRPSSSAANFRMIEEKQKADAKKKSKLPTGKITRYSTAPAPVSSPAPTGTGGPGFEFSGLPTLDLSGIDFSGMDLSGIDLSGVGVTPGQTPEQTAADALDKNLAPLTTEQEEQLATQNRQLEAEYARLVAAFTKQDEEARAAEKQARGLAQNIAAGESQNLRTQLASIGMEESPGPAIVGQESIAAQSDAQQTAARGSLSQLLAQIEADKAKAEAQKLLGQTDLEKVRNQLRIGNSLANLQSMFEQFGEL